MAMARHDDESTSPVIALDEASPEPKYLQIAEQVRRLAAEGRLRPGDPLPSVRQLAGDLGINVNTVLAAYRALEAEDVVLLRRGSRAVVHPRLARPAAPDAAALGRVRALLERVRTDALLLGLTPAMIRSLAEEIFAAPPDP
jgi:GntR family transcriptional regulator